LIIHVTNHTEVSVDNFETVCYFALKERESGLTDLSQRREREATQREVEKLKESIQTLTR